MNGRPVEAAMRRPCLLLLLFVGAILAGCGERAELDADAPAHPDLPGLAVDEHVHGGLPACVGEPPGWPEEDLVVVEGERPVCELDFVEVVRLQGTEEEWAPRPPIAVGPGETYVSATYQPGRLARWSSNGELEQVFGRGEGEGPGEFRGTSAIVIGPDSVVYVMSGPRAHLYAPDGEFLETIRWPGVSGQRSTVITSDGVLVVSTRRPGDPLRPALLAWRDGDWNELESSAGRPGQRYSLAHSPGLGLWSAEAGTYEVTQHDMPGGEVRLRVSRTASWFPGDGRYRANLYGILADDRGLIWTLMSTPAPDAPAAPAPSAESLEELSSIVAAYRENMIEALAVDGRLIASRRYPDPRLAPTPMTPSRWFLQEDDLLRSVVILEPVVRSKASPPVTSGSEHSPRQHPA